MQSLHPLTIQQEEISIPGRTGLCSRWVRTASWWTGYTSALALDWWEPWLDVVFAHPPCSCDTAPPDGMAEM